MIVIAADTHKSTHSFSAVHEHTGRLVGGKTFGADDRGMLATLRWAQGFEDAERVWALEDCRHVSGRLERALVAAGERVIRAAPKLMGESRRAEREAGAAVSVSILAWIAIANRPATPDTWSTTPTASPTTQRPRDPPSGPHDARARPRRALPAPRRGRPQQGPHAPGAVATPVRLPGRLSSSWESAASTRRRCTGSSRGIGPLRKRPCLSGVSSFRGETCGGNIEAIGSD